LTLVSRLAPGRRQVWGADRREAALPSISVW